MWIFLGILAFIVLLIIVILLSPVSIIIKNDKDNNLILLYKFLFKTFGENPNPNNPIALAFKRATGVSNLEPQNFKKEVKKNGFQGTLSQTLKILADILKEVVKLFKYCSAEKFEFQVVCSSKDAADAAIRYGECCALVYPVIGFIASVLKIKDKGRNIDIRCEYDRCPESIRYDLLIKVRLFRILAALWRVSYNEGKRIVETKEKTKA